MKDISVFSILSNHLPILSGMEFPSSNHVNSKLHVHLQKDYEQFLNSFEKPAQIYRVLRERYLEQPIFLNRNLSYMRQQTDNPKTVTSRRKFNLAEVLNTCLKERELIENDKDSESCLKIEFKKFSVTNQVELGYTDDSSWEVNLELKHPVASPAKFENIQLGNFSFPSTNSSDDQTNQPLTVPFKTFKSHSVADLQQTSLIFSIKRLPSPSSSPISTPELTIVDISTENSCDYTPVKSAKRANGQLRSPKFNLDLNSSDNSTPLLSKHRNCKKRRYTGNDSSQKPTKRTRYIRYKNRDTPNKSINKIHTDKNTASPSKQQFEDIYKQKTDILLEKIRNLYPKSINNIVELKLFNNKGENCLLKKGNYEIYFSVPGKETSIEPDRPNIIRYALSFGLSWTGEHPTTRDLTHYSTPLKLAMQKLYNTSYNLEIPHKQAKNTEQQINNTPTIYNFIYESNTYQQTQQNSRFECPLCSLVCPRDYSLLQHLNSTHPRLDFRYIPSDSLTVVDVRVNSEYDGSFSGDAKELGRQGIALWRFGPIRRKPYTSIIHYSAGGRVRQESIAKFIASYNDDCQQFMGMDRVFFHSRTCHPILPSEINSDSEDENNEWLVTQTKKLINDFTDVNKDEKEIMKLWNIFMIQKRVVGDCNVSSSCVAFAKLHRAIIREKSLTNNFLAHLVQLSDQGLITTDHVQESISIITSS